MSLEDKIAAAQSPYGGKHVGMLSGDIRDVKREMENIAEDYNNEDWATKATQYQLIGLSAAVRTLGAVISAFFAVMTRPQNEQAIGFETEGDFILRCVATPMSTATGSATTASPRNDGSFAPRHRRPPIRVRKIQARATEANRGEQNQIRASAWSSRRHGRAGPQR